MMSKPRRVGPYVLERLLGAGGFGEVWLARREGELAHTQLAVKLPLAALVDVTAVRQEAELWARVGGHPNVIPIFEASVYDGQVVIVSEYAAGGSLADWLKARQGNATPPNAAAQLVLGVLAGLGHLHQLGVIHRDIKPANVLLQNGLARLADFGISRAMHTEAVSGQPAGTPAYMAPEAFDGVRSVQTDVWSVGVMLYQLLTGVLPYPEREWTSLLKSILTRDPPPLPAGVPAQYGEIICRCLAKDPARRFRSAGEMAAELEQLARPPGVAINSVRLLAHLAAFAGSMRFALFVNATNLSETTDREITHIWIEARPKVYVDNPRRPLPKRLKPQETWETWIEVWGLSKELLTEDLPTLARARLSTGDIIHSIPNESVPDSGWIPGESDNNTIGPEQPPSHHQLSPRTRPWWRFW
jgi:serine/threonine-protein kinase